MDNQETPIKGRPKRSRGLRTVVENIGLAFEEHVIWRGGDAVRAVFDVVRWPFERISWGLQRGLIWPLQDRLAVLSGAGRALAVAAVAVMVAGLTVAGFAAVGSGGSANSTSAVAVASKPVAETVPPAENAEKEPTLQGAAPVFKQDSAGASSEVDRAKPIESPTAQSSGSASSAATGTISSSPATSSSGGAEASSVDGPPAGPAAIAVARDFAGAFLVYETGGEESAVRKTFAATATPELTKSLLRRPPRLPANVKVPKAKVVNVVAGPSHGGVYSVSVSLLRVGVTSELRLDMEKLKKDSWRVTNVLG